MGYSEVLSSFSHDGEGKFVPVDNSRSININAVESFVDVSSVWDLHESPSLSVFSNAKFASATIIECVECLIELLLQLLIGCVSI